MREPVRSLRILFSYHIENIKVLILENIYWIVKSKFRTLSFSKGNKLLHNSSKYFSSI